MKQKIESHIENLYSLCPKIAHGENCNIEIFAAFDVSDKLLKEVLEREGKLIAGIKIHITYEESQIDIICKAAKHWKGMTTKNRRRWHRLQELKKVLEELEIK